MSIVICRVCGDTWEVPEEACPPDGLSICSLCDEDDWVDDDDNGIFEWEQEGWAE
jgi:hypothetical protein